MFIGLSIYVFVDY